MGMDFTFWLRKGSATGLGTLLLGWTFDWKVEVKETDPEAVVLKGTLGRSRAEISEKESVAFS
jgi:hypothetical protein